MKATNTEGSLASRLVARMRDIGATQSEVAERAGVSQAAIQKLATGRAKSSRKIVEIADALGVTAAWLLQGVSLSSDDVAAGGDEWDHDIPLRSDDCDIPFFKEVYLSAGSGSIAITDRPNSKVRFSKSSLRKVGVQANQAICLRVTGNSMEPLIPSGSVVGVNTGNSDVEDGKVYAINHEGELRIKYLYRLPGGGLRLRSANASEHPEEIYRPDEGANIAVIGRVFWYSVFF